MEAHGMQRRLTAIMSADVVGYSRLMAADEEGTLARLKAHREELFDPAIAEHQGRIVKLMGDGALVEFTSVVEAVRAGVELMLPVLQGHAASSRQAPGHQQVEDNRIVNIASSTQSTTANDHRPIRWYQIKKNDRYVSIARSQLGDASRWRELFELNKDKFPDPQRIREGVRIKLPVDASPTPRGGGH